MHTVFFIRALKLKIWSLLRSLIHTPVRLPPLSQPQNLSSSLRPLPHVLPAPGSFGKLACSPPPACGAVVNLLPSFYLIFLKLVFLQEFGRYHNTARMAAIWIRKMGFSLLRGSFPPPDSVSAVAIFLLLPPWSLLYFQKLVDFCILILIYSYNNKCNSFHDFPTFLFLKKTTTHQTAFGTSVVEIWRGRHTSTMEEARVLLT